MPEAKPGGGNRSGCNESRFRVAVPCSCGDGRPGELAMSELERSKPSAAWRSPNARVSGAQRVVLVITLNRE